MKPRAATANDIKMVAPALEKYAPGPLADSGNVRGPHHGTAASSPWPQTATADMAFAQPE
ncbi:MAG TPA: hypothetical protein VI636_19240 [Candidatus Angelobacter sp.]